MNRGFVNYPPGAEYVQPEMMAIDFTEGEHMKLTAADLAEIIKDDTEGVVVNAIAEALGRRRRKLGLQS